MEVVKLAKKRPAGAASPSASACAAFTANPLWQPGVVTSPCVSPRAGAGSHSTVFPEPVQEMAHGLPVTLIVEQIWAR